MFLQSCLMSLLTCMGYKFEAIMLSCMKKLRDTSLTSLYHKGCFLSSFSDNNVLLCLKLLMYLSIQPLTNSLAQNVAAKRGCLSQLLSASTNPDVVDLDADHEDPQLCSDYAPDIYENLRVFEVCALNNKAFVCSILILFSRPVMNRAKYWFKIQLSNPGQIVVKTIIIKYV